MTITDPLRRFFGSRGYVVLTALLVFLGHSTLRQDDRLLFGGYQEFVFGGILVLTIAVACMVCTDLRFFLMPVMSFAFIIPTIHSANVPYYSKFYLEHIPITLEYVLGVLLVGSVVCFMAKNNAARVSFRKPMLFSMAVFCATLMLNGIGSEYYCFSDTVYPLTMAIALLVFYVLFSAYLRFDQRVFDHFMFCILVLGLMITAQLIFTYLDNGPEGMKFPASGGIDKESLLFGWGNSTAIGGMLAFLMPSGFYFAYSHRHGWVYYLLGGVMYIGVFLSQSRGALVAATGTLALCLLTLLRGGKNRRINRIFTGLVALVGIGIVALFFQKLIRLVRTMIELSLSAGDNGRFHIWRIAVEKFLEYPIFGAGFYTDFTYVGWKKDVYPYLYHNTPLQVLASGGIVAFATYVYHRVQTVLLVLRKPDPYKTFLGFCILGLLIFCLFEVIFFSTYPTIIYSLMLLFIERKAEAAEAEPVPQTLPQLVVENEAEGSVEA